MSFTLKDFPGRRDEFRELLRGQLPSLFDNVNQHLLARAHEHLRPRGYGGGIVMIVDDLDKIPQRVLPDERTTNHEEIFLHQGRLLRSLHCDVLYTIPIELAYSHCQNELVNTYGGAIKALPVIALRDAYGADKPEGMAALRSIFERRVREADGRAGDVFADEQVLERVLRSTGGHVRSLCLAVREALDQADSLPIEVGAADRTFKRLARDMRRSLQGGDLELLQRVADTGDEVDEPAFFRLLRGGYVLAYQDDASDWYAPHPWLGIGPVP